MAAAVGAAQLSHCCRLHCVQELNLQLECNGCMHSPRQQHDSSCWLRCAHTQACSLSGHVRYRWAIAYVAPGGDGQLLLWL